MAFPRRYSALPLPAYRYVPGRTPHPTRDRRGHSFGREEAVELLEPEHWRRCESYLFGIDLLNRGYWWEAHESLEGLWRGAGRESEPGRLLQGLILVAAALLKHSMGAEEAARHLAARGCEKLRRAPDGLLGVDGAAFAGQVEAHLAGERREAPVVELRGPLVDSWVRPARGGSAVAGSMSFDVRLDAPYTEALEQVVAALEKEGFGVLTRIDAHEAFKKKLGVEFRPYTILGACNPPLAHRALSAAAEVGLLLPCNVTVESDESGGSVVRILDPEKMMGVGGFSQDSPIAQVGREARARLRRVADALAG